MSKKPLYPHVPKGIQKLKVTAFAAETERIAAERTITRGEEEAIRVAQNVIQEIHQLKPQLDKLYDKVKSSMPGWEGPRSIAADLTNAAGQLEYELTEKIRAFRLKR